jgi:uncharacterized phosphatase
MERMKCSLKSRPSVFAARTCTISATAGFGDFVVDAPLVLGHQASGTIVAVGEGVDPSRVGQRVAIEPQRPCGKCRECLAGLYNLCPRMEFYATPPVDGAFAEYAVIRDAFAHAIPGTLKDEAAALLDTPTPGPLRFISPLVAWWIWIPWSQDALGWTRLRRRLKATRTPVPSNRSCTPGDEEPVGPRGPVPTGLLSCLFREHAPRQGRMEGVTLTTFALIRHGQTDWNAQRRLQGSTDIPLNDVGRQQARDAVAVLSGYEWDAIVSSPLSRAAETADLIAEGLGLSVARRIPELTERTFGPAEGMQDGPELDALRIPGGFRGAESEDDAAARGLAALEALAEEFSGRRLLVVAHGTLLRVTLSRAVGTTLQSVDNAVLNLAHHHAIDGWQLEYFNGEPVLAAAHD